MNDTTDPYKRMIEESSFEESEALFNKLFERVEDTMLMDQVYESGSPLYFVEGLAIIQASVARVAMSVPGFGQMRENNPQPDFVQLEANAVGYTEIPIITS